MALNVKVAMVTCLFFIGGMSWMVHQVATPVVAAPAPVVVLRAPAEPPSSLMPTLVYDRPGPAGQFAHASVTAPSELGTMVQPMAVAMAQPEETTIDLPPIAAGETYKVGLTSPPAFVTADDFEPMAAQDDGEQPEELLWNRPSAEVPMAVLASNARIVEEPLLEPLLIESSQRVDMAAALAAYTEGSDAAERTLSIDPPSGKLYVVRSGDSIVGLLKSEWNHSGADSINAFLAVNPKVRARKNNIIRIGETVVIPSRESAMAHMMLTLSDAGHQEAESKSSQPRSKKRRLYKVRPHDTLAKIARKELRDSDRWVEIYKLNRMKNADVIIPGTEIMLPEQNGLEAQVGA